MNDSRFRPKHNKKFVAIHTQLTTQFRLDNLTKVKQLESQNHMAASCKQEA